MKKILPALLVVASSVHMGYAQQSRQPQKVFTVNNPDHTLSPYTGMTRKHWKDAALYLLEGAFSYIKTMDDPMKFPKQPGKSYPRNEAQVPAEKLEGLCRTFFVAASLLKDDPSLVINNMKVAEYYRYQIGKLIDSTSPGYIRKRAPNGGPSQVLVEFGALSLSLFLVPEVIWDPLPQAQKDTLAATMLSYGDGPTIGSNWKFFNIFVLSFFKMKGYTVNEKLLVEYLDKSLAHYRGNGWYNDAPAYDYYSMWAFQMYGAVWAEFFGKKYYPQYAQRFMNNFKEVKNSYPYMFSRKGEMIMWGRSMSYRFASVIPFPLMGLENDPSINYGWMRRISSGVLLQFLKNPDFLQDNIPTLGFYGPFEPAVQSYSCRGSAFWMAKAFLGLMVPASNPFWTAKENEGAWEKELAKGKAYNKFQEGSNILITDYPDIGASEVRAWCHVKAIGAGEPFRSSENYNRLAYNSAFPWQADGTDGEVSMNYVIRNQKGEWEPLRLYTFKRFEDGIYYRDAVLETNEKIKLSLADFPVANGIIRIDRIEVADSIRLRLGHYSLPNVKGYIRHQKKKVKGREVQIIDNGVYQLALVSMSGWDGMEVIRSKGLHPVAESSAVLNVTDKYLPAAGQGEIYCTLMLWKKSGEKWTADELVPVKQMSYSKTENAVGLILTSGEKKQVKFNDKN
ncbi:MAG: DUF2264 domain-containing protein [Chitinophagaceae bacterium]